MQKQIKSTTRLACLVAVLLVSLAWQCLAEEYVTPDIEVNPVKRVKIPKLQPPKYSAEDVPEALRLAETAQRLIVLAESANNSTTGAAKKVTELHARAETAVNATKSKATEAETAAVAKTASTAARKAAQDAKLAAEIAQELYGNATAHPALIDEHTKWYKERHSEAKKLEPTLTAAVEALEKSKNDMNEGDMTQLLGAVLRPARSILKLAHNAENDAKYIALKRLYAELLAERVEIMDDLANRAKGRVNNDSDVTTEESCTSQENIAAFLQRRQAAAKAYLETVSSRKIAVRCSSRISENATKVKEMYYAIKISLAKAKEEDYKTLRVHHTIADEAHTNAEESKRVAASTSENAAMYMQEAKSALNSITACASEREAQLYTKIARRASHRALNEAHFAMHQLFTATVSLQQVTDAKSAVEKKNSQNTETDNGITDPKENAIKSEKTAEASYIRVRADADEATDKLHRAEETIKQTRRLVANYGYKGIAAKMEEYLETAKAAVRELRASSKQAQKAASNVHAHYDDTKAAADSALGAFVQTNVTKLERDAAKAAIATQESETTNGPKARQALKKVTQHELQAIKAYEEAKQVVAEVHQTKQHTQK